MKDKINAILFYWDKKDFLLYYMFMLLTFLPSLKENRLIRLIDRFLYSKPYILMYGCLIFLCNVFSFEIPLFYFIVVVSVILPTLICDDLLPIVAPISMTYVSISLKSNNNIAGISLFGGTKIIHFYVLPSIIVVFLFSKIILDLIKKPNRRIKPRLALGYLFLGVCFLLNGLFTSYYEKNTVLYGLVCFLSISGVYFLLLYGVNWANVKKDYFAWIMMVLGVVVSAEVLFIVISIKCGHTEYVSYLGHMFTGWGMRNNIAGQICLCVGLPVLLAIQNKKNSWIFLCVPFLMVACCFLTESRGGFLTSLIILIISFIIYFLKTEKSQKKQGMYVIFSVVGVLGLLAIIFRNQVVSLSSRFLDFNTDLYEFTQGRNETWMNGFNHFRESELFGVGFYQCKDFRFWNFATSFIPARYHNIYVQLLASTGILGFAAYLFHRWQTLSMTFKSPTIEKTFIYLTVAALVLSSLVDNHFFNLGPGLNYCVALAFIEGENIKSRLNY